MGRKSRSKQIAFLTLARPRSPYDTCHQLFRGFVQLLKCFSGLLMADVVKLHCVLKSNHQYIERGTLSFCSVLFDIKYEILLHLETALPWQWLQCS
ncbi:hypothetical protein LINPERHAP1_LOCUS9577 [Linum perenne]